MSILKKSVIVNTGRSPGAQQENDVEERKLEQNDVEENIFVTNWRPGIYLVQVILDDKILVKKLT